MLHVPPNLRGRRGYCYFVRTLMAGTLLLIGCTVEKPVAPRWETIVAVPLIDKTFTVAKIVEDEDNLFSDPEGLVHFAVTKALDRYEVGERLKIEGIDRSISGQIGSFQISSPDTATVHVTLGEIFPPSRDMPPGQSAVVPAFNFESPPKTADRFETFQYIKLASGLLEVTVRNDLPIPLGQLPDHPLTTKILAENPSGQPLEVIQYSDQIPAHSARTKVIDLAGHYLPNQFSITVSGGSPGSNGTSVQIDPELGFAVAVFLRDLRVEEALAKVPSQEVQLHDTFDIKDTLSVQSAVIKHGRIRIEMENTLPVGAVIDYSMPNFLKSGEPLTGRFVLEPRAFSNEEIVLDSTEIRSSELSRPGEQQLGFDWSFHTLDTGESMVQLHATDSIAAHLHADEIVFSRMTGELANVRLRLEPMVRTIRVPNHLDSLNFAAVTLDLQLRHTLQIPARAQINIEGSNHSGQVATLTLEPQLQPSENGAERVDHLYIDQDYPGLLEFLNILPTQFVVKGMIQIGAPGWVASVSETDWVEGALSLSAPVAVAIPEQTTQSDVDTLDMDVEDRKDILEHIREVRFVADAANHLPIGANVVFKFGRVDSLVYERPKLTIGPIALDAGQLAANGLVAQQAENHIELSLTEAQLSFFERDPVFTGVEVHQPGSNGQTVAVRSSDYLKVSAFLRAVVLIKEGGGDEGN